MPYHTFRVSSTEIVHHEARVGYVGVNNIRKEYPAFDERSIRCKVPNEDIRPWGRQLYAFLGILFVPILIDSFWSAVFSHHRYQLKHDDTRTHSTYREWVSKPRNMLLLPITFPFVVYFTVMGACSQVLIMPFIGFTPFRYTPNHMRFPFAEHDPLFPAVLWCKIARERKLIPFDKFQFFNSHLSKTYSGENDNEDTWEFVINTDPEYDIAVDQHFKMRFAPFMYWCFIRGDSLATGGSAESQV